MPEFKTIREIADEYERNLVPMRQRRDELRQQLESMPRGTQPYRLRQRITRLAAMISSTEVAVNVMRKYWGDDHG